jgi:Uma2 family endonuclease
MPHATTASPPALANGDRLTRDEFEHRYRTMPDVKNAELIEGQVYMPSPVHYNAHGKPHSAIIGWLFNYAVATPHVSVGDNATVRLDLDNEPQPDALLRIDAACGGQSRISDDDYVEGAPELVVEIAHSSAAYDLHDKKQAYRRNGVCEYVVWVQHENRIDWFVLEGGAYRMQSPDADGRIESTAFPGLVLDVDALLQGDLATVVSAVQDGTASSAHQAFAQQLQEAAA